MSTTQGKNKNKKKTSTSTKSDNSQQDSTQTPKKNDIELVDVDRMQNLCVKQTEHNDSAQVNNFNLSTANQPGSSAATANSDMHMPMPMPIPISIPIDKNAENDDDYEYENNIKNMTSNIRRRGRRPKDKFKYEVVNPDDFNNIIAKDENIIIRLPSSCLSLCDELNQEEKVVPHNLNLTTQKTLNYGNNNNDKKVANSIGKYYSIIDGAIINDYVDTTVNRLKEDNNEAKVEYSADMLDYKKLVINSLIGSGNNGNSNNIGCNNSNNLEQFKKTLPCPTCGIAKSNYPDNSDRTTTATTTTDYKDVSMNPIVDANINTNANYNSRYTNMYQYDCCDGVRSAAIQPSTPIRQIDIILNNKYNCNNDKIDVLTQLCSAVKSYDEYGGACGETLTSCWPLTTKIACFWCCHQFECTPWGIPVKYFDGKFQLFGIYCSANCTLSGIVHGNQLPENLWERVSLLNLLYFKVYGIYDNLIPAPDKMALKMFGGSLDIADYRRITNSNEKSYTLEFPPCNTIIPVLEEIYKKNTLTSTFIPVDSNRIKKANNELKLKRSKPLNNNKSNLYASMGIK